MLDIKQLRNDLDTVFDRLQIKGFTLDRDKFLQLEQDRKDCQTVVEALQAQRNVDSKRIGLAKRNGEDITQLTAAVQDLGQKLSAGQQRLQEIQEELQQMLWSIPNLLDDSVPAGKSEEDNVEIRQWGQPTVFDFAVKDHVELGEGLAAMDFGLAAKLTGSRFVVLKNQLAKLHRALVQFMLDTHTQQHGYQEYYLPYITNTESLYGSGQLPKFAEDLFWLKGKQSYALIPTAEIMLANALRDEIVAGEKLPLKYTSHTACFRSEAGAYGKDTRGMIRQHQFEKVELFQFVRPDQSYQALEEITQQAETILQKLKLPYRVMLLCGGDTGFSSAKTYDLEVWLPAQNCYREISSCSNCEDFQARRMQARFRENLQAKPEYLHTLNGSGLAVGRTLVAVLENYQDAAGRIQIPEVLQPYMNGRTIIG